MSMEHVNGHTYSDPISKDFKEHRIRIVIDKEGEPWWIASDICDILGLKTNDAVSILDDDEIRIDQFKHDAIDFEFNRVLVNRSGAYSIIIVSDYPDKKAFRKFIKKQTICDWKAEATNHVAKPEIPLNPPLPKGEDINPTPGKDKDLNPTLEKGGRGDSLSQVEPINPVVAVIGTRPITTSLAIAKTFGKGHKDVLRAIKSLETPDEFNQRNFAPVEYQDVKGELRPMYQITRDGFTFLAMGFNGKRATEFKLAYIDAFNKMEEALRKQAYAGIEQKLRTQLALPDPTVIANARKEATGAALKLANCINKMGSGMPELARLCSLRRANLTQDECSLLLGIKATKIKEIERHLRGVGVSFKQVIGNKRRFVETQNLASLLGMQADYHFVDANGMVQEVTHV